MIDRRAQLIVFSAECLFKIFGEGLALWRYWICKDWKWNSFDFFIVILCTPGVDTLLGTDSSSAALLRLMRLMRLVKVRHIVSCHRHRHRRRRHHEREGDHPAPSERTPRTRRRRRCARTAQVGGDGRSRDRVVARFVGQGSGCGPIEAGFVARDPF